MCRSHLRYILSSVLFQYLRFCVPNTYIELTIDIFDKQTGEVVWNDMDRKRKRSVMERESIEKLRFLQRVTIISTPANTIQSSARDH